MLNKYCVDCGKRVARLGSKRCHPCFFIYLSKITKGKEKTQEHIDKISGNKHYNWQGGKITTKDGYIKIKNQSKKYEFEHRVVMEQKLGRKLDICERVHHINNIRDDNRIENLILFNNHSEHLIFEHKLGKKFNHS
jgi:hypothetical protein